MEKFPRGRDLVVASGLDVQESTNAAEEDLLRVHSAAYLEMVRKGEWGSTERTRMGLPVDDRLYRRCSSETGGTICAGRAALEHGMAANLGGGTHHAARSRASGYCIFNDVAVAVRALRVEHPDLFVMVIDTDAHQGDGTNEIFEDDVRTYTYSIHVGANYPARKVAGSHDVPLARFVDGLTYLDAFRSSLEASFFEFEPDIIFWVSGADIHFDDRFGQMGLTTEEIEVRNSFVLSLSRSWRVPLTIVYGGGYNRDVSLTNRLHVMPVLQMKEAS